MKYKAHRLIDQRTMPGDEQTAEMVALWVRTHVKTEAVMVLRCQHKHGIEYRLVSVDLITTSASYFYIPGLGSFEPNGFLSPPGPGIVRLLFPTRELFTWAAGDYLWVPGNIVQNPRTPDANYEILRSRLVEQMKTLGVTWDVAQPRRVGAGGAGGEATAPPPYSNSARSAPEAP